MPVSTTQHISVQAHPICCALHPVLTVYGGRTTLPLRSRNIEIQPGLEPIYSLPAEYARLLQPARHLAKTTATMAIFSPLELDRRDRPA